MKKATLLSLLICLLSFIGAKAQTCTIINNTPFNYKHISVELDAPSTPPPIPMTTLGYFVPAWGSISFTNTYSGLAGGIPGAGGHFIRAITIEQMSGMLIGQFQSPLALTAYSFGGLGITSYINPLTGGVCTWAEAYNFMTGEHDVTITIN